MTTIPLTPAATPPSGSVVSAKNATVFLPTPFHPEAERQAEQTFHRVLRVGQDGLSREDCLRECDAICAFGSESEQVKAADLESSVAPKLQIIARNGTGVDSIDLEACKKRGVVVTNWPGGNAQAVAELTLTLMLSLLRRVPEMSRRITSGELVPSIRALAPGLFNKTVGFVGMGDIAYEVAKLLSVFQCRLLVYSPTSPASRWSGGGADPRYPLPIRHERVETLDEVLVEADVLSLHCPLTPGTRNMIGEGELRRMKRSAVVINTSRGGMIDERALERALKAGEIGGAGLDVFAQEPAYGENLGELGTLDNVICLPHLGGSTEAQTRDGCMTAVSIVADYLDGKGAINRVV
ncbi:hypothetical protein P7C73_g4236, partial [Tremellales sp. Uapishka_1]